ncbi:MAG: DUF2255 family protein [Actinomycetes bacterium]
MMSTWTGDELDRIGGADEVTVAPRRPDGSLRGGTTIWVVRVGEELFVRSWNGRRGSWFRTALRSHEGRVRAGRLERDVRFAEPGDDTRAAVDSAYRTKYARHGDAYVLPLVGDDAAAATLRLVPQ